MKDKIKRWIIYKLGGMVVTDLPIDLSIELMRRQTEATCSKHCIEVLKNGFKTD